MNRMPKSPMMRFSPMYSYVRSRQLEGTFPGGPKTGAWSISALRVGYGWGAVPEEAWPYDEAWPPVEPAEIEVVASSHRTGPYWRVRTLDECKAVLANLGLPVMLSMEITQDWYDAPHGHIPAQHAHGESAGIHSVIVVGYDDVSSEIKLQNSWASVGEIAALATSRIRFLIMLGGKDGRFVPRITLPLPNECIRV